jgi:bacterioferritin-associated ferredoxin
MFICICNGIRASDLRGAARGGARTTEQAYAAMGIEACCGQCLEYGQEIINDEIKTHAKAS